MSKRIICLRMLALLLILGLSTLAFYVELVRAEPTIITVPDDYPTIQKAINAATSGDTIYVRVGTYYEHIVVNKSLSLVGEDRSNTIVDGNGTGTIFYITQNGVNITSFTIQNSEPYWEPNAGIRLENYVSDCYITGNNVRNNNAGLLLILASGNTISGNSITNNTYGIFPWCARSNTIFGNNIANNEQGIAVDEGIDNVIFHNNFVNNTHQVAIWTPLPEFTNVWDDGYPSGGNYWSNYGGVDVKRGPNQDQPGSDGIGDVSYGIDEGNTDRYPLMEPWPPSQPAPVGGICIPVNKLSLLVPYIGFTILLAVAVMTVVCVKNRKRDTELLSQMK